MTDVPSNLIPTRITQLPLAPVADENSLMMIVYQGNNYQIRVGDLLSVAGVPTTRQVIAGTGMTGGGQLSSNVTLSIAPGGVGSVQLANSGVTPGIYGNSTDIPVFTVDNTGRVVAATTIPATISGYVPETRQVIAGTGLTGGGQLTSNVTLTANLSNLTPEVGDNAGSAGVSTEIARADHVHPAVDLSDQDQINGILPMDQGGTARSLVPNAGAIVWSGADGLYISAAGSPGQVLVSGGTNAPTWGSALIVGDQPANVVYAGPAAGPTAPTTFRALVTADLPNSGASAGTYGSQTVVPVITVNGKGQVTSATNTTINAVTLTTGSISTAPTNGTDIVNKNYADSIATGINFHQACRLATTAPLPSCTYNNGSSGVGATLTATTTSALSVDSTPVVATNRVLVKNQVNGAENGVYVVTQAGNGGSPFILTRATDFDTPGTGVNQIDAGDFFLITAGSTNANTSWVQQTPLPITVGTTSIVFSQFGAGGITYTAGTGLTLAGTVFSITNTAVAAGSYGSASSVGTFTVNAQGQLTAAANSSIAIAATQVTSGTLDTARLSGSYTGITGVGTLTTPTVVSTNSSDTALRITQTGTGNALVVEDSANPDATPFVVDQNGGVGLGSLTPVQPSGFAASKFWVAMGDDSHGSLAAYSNTGAGFAPTWNLMRSRASVIGTQTVVQSGDRLGQITFCGSDGTAFLRGASIIADVDGTPGTNDMPGRLVFSTTADGAASPTERMRITNAGRVGIGTPNPGARLALSHDRTGGGFMQAWSSLNGATFENDTLLSFDGSAARFGNFQSFPLAFLTNNLERMRIDATGNVGVGGIPGAGRNFALSSPITGSTVSRAYTAIGTIQSDVTGTASYFATSANTAAASFTLGDMRHYTAIQGAFGAGSTVTNQMGFVAEASLTGATNNFGFYSGIAAGTGRWNFYADGTANNYFAGNVGIGTTAPTATLNVVANSASDAVRITQTGSGNALVVEDAANPDSSPFVVDANGRVLAGATASYPGIFGNAGNFQISSTSLQGIQSARFANDIFGSDIQLLKSRSTAIAGHTIVQNNDSFGNILFGGSDGTSYLNGAMITGSVDGVPGTNDMPGRLVFWTTADGAANPTERMRIDAAGNVGIGTASPGSRLQVAGTVTATAYSGIDGGTF